VDRCALFVDAGYVLADGAMAVHGTRHRESVSWDYAGLLQFFGSIARERTSHPVLRCYWYEATVEGRRSAEHDTLADLPGLKLRLGRARPGRRDGVESEIRRDLTTLARNNAISDALLVSAEEDLAQVVADVQDLGIRVLIVHITVGGNWTISRSLRQECDDIIEIGEGQLRPYTELVCGAGALRAEEPYQLAVPAGRVITNGHGPVSGPLGGHQALVPGGHPAPPAIYTAPVVAEYQRSAQPAPEPGPPPLPRRQPTDAAGRQVMPPAPGRNGTAALPDPLRAAGMPPRAGGAQPSPAAPAQPEPRLAAAPAVQPQRGTPGRPRMTGPPSGPGQPAAGRLTGQPVPSGPQPFPGQTIPGRPDSGRPEPGQPDLGRPEPGQPDLGRPEPGQPDLGRPEPGQPPGPGPLPGQSAAGQQAGLEAVPGQTAAGQPSGLEAVPGPLGRLNSPGRLGQHAAPGAPGRPGPGEVSQFTGFPGPSSSGPTGSRARGAHAQPAADDQTLPPGGRPLYQAAPTSSYHAPALEAERGSRPSLSGLPMPPEPAQPAHDADEQTGPMPGVSGLSRPPAPDVSGPGRLPATGGGGPASPPAPGVSGPLPSPPPQPENTGASYVPQSPYPGPQPSAPPAPARPAQELPVTGAAAAAHAEGFEFGQSVAREAPALWLEAVLARKPRMPSDLEARLLQDSALPIDSLLHDETRHALRRGFWDALERSRR
jgi:NYN domain